MARRGIACFSLVLLSTACAGGERLGSSAHAIVNGTDHTGHAAVGNFTFQQPNKTNRSTCTATLVGPLTAITAAHCVVLQMSDARLELDSGNIDVTDVMSHPSYDPQMPWLADLGLLFLATQPSGVKPLRLAVDPPLQDEPVTLVGYGKTGDNNDDDGVKRIATNRVAQVLTQHIAVAPATKTSGAPCHGDSGGPILRLDPQQTGTDDDVVIATVSYATGNCGSRSLHPRVDYYRSWLESSQRELRWYDVEAPSVSIDAPTDGEVLDTPRDVPVAITASDNIGVREIVLSLDGQPLATLASTLYTYTIARDAIAKLAAGKHALVAEAHDAEGNRSSVTATFEIAAQATPDAGAPDGSPSDAGDGTDIGGPPRAEGGCALAGADVAAPPVLLLLLLPLLLRARRGPRRLIALVIAIAGCQPPPARQPTSTISQRQPPVAQPQRRPRAIYARREKRVVARPAPVLHLATPLGVLRRGSTLVLRGVGFQPSKATIRPASRPVLDGLVRARAISPRAVIQIEGHLGFFHGYARRLGRDRACAIARYLVQHGIARDRLRCIGFGETRPLVAPKTRAARLRNTRVEIRLL